MRQSNSFAVNLLIVTLQIAEKGKSSLQSST